MLDRKFVLFSTDCSSLSETLVICGDETMLSIASLLGVHRKPPQQSKYMNILFFTLLGIAAFHLVYEGIILPSIRLKLRYELFALRDALRHAKATHDKQVPDNVFKYLQNAINVGLNLLPRTDMRLAFAVHEAIKADSNLETRIEKRESAIEECDVPEIRTINARIGEVASLAFVANGGAWFIYLIPIAIVAFCFGGLVRGRFPTARSVVRDLPLL